MTATRALAAVTVLSLLACGGTETPPPEPTPAVAPPPAATPGKIANLDYPETFTTAVAGDFVLTPSRESLDRAVTDGVEKSTFIYYGATVIAPGPVESKIKSLAGTEYTMPNSLIVAIPRAYQAQVGDVLLTHWESGSGLQRAIVTGGVPGSPVVRYLDMDWDNPSGIGQKEDTLKPDHYTPVVRGAVGSTVACKKDGGYAHGVMVGLQGGKVLHLGFAGRLAAYTTADCVALDPRPVVKIGDSVQVPYIGSFTAGTVVRVDAPVGRVWTKIMFGGQEKEVAASWADTALSLAALGEGFGGAPAPTPVAVPVPVPVPSTGPTKIGGAREVETGGTTGGSRAGGTTGGSRDANKGGGGGNKGGGNKGGKGDGKNDKNKTGGNR